MEGGVSSGKLAYVTAATVGVGTVIISYIWLWMKEQKKKKTLPSQWKHVGNLTNIVMYPVKSMGPMHMDTVECTSLGPKSGSIYDRNLMVVNTKGHFVSGRQYPKLTQITPSISGTKLTLFAENSKSITLDLNDFHSTETNVQVKVWGESVVGRDCGEEVAQWLSRVILENDAGLRLVYYPLNHSTRIKPSQSKIFTLIEQEDVGIFSDETSYTLINETSVDDLNERSSEYIYLSQFRMNFQIKLPVAFEEDSWDWVKIGDVVFRNIRPCTRCVMTTINPNTGEKDIKNEPLLTLKKYRQVTDAKIRSAVGESPMMGIHLGLKGSAGNISLGDPVFINVC